MRVIARMNLGGPAHQVSYLSGRRFYPERYETLLVHGSLAPGEESMSDLAEAEGATCVHVPALRQPISPAQDAAALARLVRIARHFRPDIVHTHTAKAGILGRTAALTLRRRPVIVHTYHGHVLRGYFGRIKTRAFLEAERALGRASDDLIGVSEQTTDELISLGVSPRDRFRTIPLGLDLQRFASSNPGVRRSLRASLGIADYEVVFVFVGRFAPIKRLDVLVRAFADAAWAESRARLLLVGDGEGRQDLEHLAKALGVRERVIFLGYRRDLDEVFSASDVAVISSDNEGTPVSLIEAGAAGLPAVATDVGGVRSVVSQGTGIVVPAGDPEVLGAALAKAAGDRDLRSRLGSAAADRMRERFAVERLLGNVDSLYRELLSS